MKNSIPPPFPNDTAIAIDWVSNVQVIAANMIREIWEDSIRHADDRGVNHRKVEVVENGQTKEVILLQANAYIISISTRNSMSDGAAKAVFNVCCCIAGFIPCSG
jgi:hypothetical protein